MSTVDHVGWTDRQTAIGQSPAWQSVSIRRYTAGTDRPVPTKYCAPGTAPAARQNLQARRDAVRERKDHSSPHQRPT